MIIIQMLVVALAIVAIGVVVNLIGEKFAK